MSTSNGSVMSKVVHRVFPRMPNFFLLLNEQCNIAVQGGEALVAFMQRGEDELGDKVREFEHEADIIKDRNLEVLNSAFSTPMDREDLQQAISTIDSVIHNCRLAVTTMQELHIPPDAHTQAFANFLLDGLKGLQQGYALLETDPAAAEAGARAARKCKRNTEKAYPRALADLYQVTARVAQPDDETASAAAADPTMAQVLWMMKKREVYRHMSYASQRVARAGAVLHDIVVKMV